MSVSYCMHHALTIAKYPQANWRQAVMSLPAECVNTDCGQPQNCRQRITEYLRVQSKALDQRNKK